MPSRSHVGSTSSSASRSMSEYSFWTETKRAVPRSRAAVSAASICSAEKFEAPIQRTLPSSTSSLSAPSVSSIGVESSGRCCW